ncbi:outer membrane lipoprotein carrier protein LolA [Microvirga makkahensis]|uniref:Outer membrane lipoprotein carrier protein LolA n=1 Tax=Microvirga makkahensis TaxID=1128670 RepID=A0A7X3MSZ6_9HYPH|nr:outer membrane lipoprotein carrier protein LolA [Microvirga makkahensis]MXQ12652.1 outer membrane lipoprotein carrier protein LolA [Microvirga makkahensis]
MLQKSLRRSIGLVLALAFASPVAAQQRASDPLTRFLDSIFKPNQGQGAPATQPQAAPVQQSEPQTGTAAPKPKAPVRQQAAQPKPQPAAAPQPAPKPSPAPAIKQATPEPRKPASPSETRSAETPKAPDPTPVKLTEPPKPARSTPAQAAPTPTPVAAQAAAVTPVSPPNPTSPAAALQRVNAYFNGMDQMSAHFVQKNPNGQQVEGTLTVQRPGRLHFAYAPPSTLEIVSDGRNVAIRDKKLGTNDVYPVSQTPLKFLVQDKVDLARDTKVRDVQIGRDGMITVSFEDSATLGGTSKITLRFDSRASALKQWTVVDAQGYETTVVLSRLNVVPRQNASAD